MATNPATAPNEKEQLRSSRRTLLIVLALFALPVAIASYLYKDSWRPAKTGNYGELIQPPREVPDMPLTSADNKNIRFADLKGRWSLVYVSPGKCEATCLKRLYYIRQIHTAFAKELERIQEVLITLDAAPDGALAEKIKEYPRVKVISGPQASLAILAERFRGAAGKNEDLTGRIYIIDPQGFIMMRYPAEPDPAGIRRDIEKLLKYSWVG